MDKNTHAERMNKLIRFIENNLDSEINVSQLAELACYSEFHFHRLFRSYIGESVYAYIFSQWLPGSNKKLRDKPCFDIYLNKDPRRTKPENLKTEIYLPIV